MDKFTLKEMIYTIYDNMEKSTNKLISPGCQDYETAKLRAKVYQKLSKCSKDIKSIANGIY